MSIPTAALATLISDEKAVTALEYGLIVSVLIGVVLVGFNALGTGLQNFFASFVAGLV